MFWIIAAVAVVLVGILAVSLLGFVLHLLFSPWVLVLAIGVLAFVKFRPRSARRNRS